MKRNHILRWVAIAIFSAATAGAVETYQIDQSASDVSFSVRKFGLTKVTGRFNRFEGTLTYDPDDMSQWSVQGTIASASIQNPGKTASNASGASSPLCT